MTNIEQSQREFMDWVDRKNGVEHPADENQGRGLDHMNKGRTLSDWLKDAAMFPVLMLGWLIWGGDE